MRTNKLYWKTTEFIRRKANKTLLVIVIGCLLYGQTSAQKYIADSTKIDQMPTVPLLPDPLVQPKKTKSITITNATEWERQQTWIRQQYQQWIAGFVPPAPTNIKAKLLHESVEGGVQKRLVELRFGPNEKAKMTLELLIPPSSKPRPVFLTQWNHRGWAQIAVKRGYIGCIYAGADSKDDTENYNAIYPDYDFATLMKRAWGAARVVDYLYTLPEVDTACIGITGHSRNGKQSLMAAAFDSRIKAVVSSSGGTGGESTFRYSDERFDSESLKEITTNFPHWFNHRLTWFAGKEQKLPVDQNSLIATIAPRGVMLVSAITEGQGNPWGIEQTYLSAKKAFHFLGADSSIVLFFRQGRHQQSARDIENFVDFFDYIFYRSAEAPKAPAYAAFNFEKWKAQSKANLNKQAFFAQPDTSLSKDSIRAKLQWLLGEEPPGIHTERSFLPNLNQNRSYKNDFLEDVIEGAALPPQVETMTIGPYHGLGNNLWGSLYVDEKFVKGKTIQGKLPLVIYLHGYSYATGYHRRSQQAIGKLVAQGFAVLAYDMIGFGTRIEERLRFYQRYPSWSVMGKMVSDTEDLVDDAYERMPFIDKENIYLAGYSLGANVALFTAIMDDRVKGLAMVSGFSSWKMDIERTEGILHYAHAHALMPRLGLFLGQEKYIPIDYKDMLASLAPKPILLMAPEADRHHPVETVKKVLEPVKKAYQQNGTIDALTVEYPVGYTYHIADYFDYVAGWLSKTVQK
jgi:cephalosporin-C deacetylase-like acetyl esterase